MGERKILPLPGSNTSAFFRTAEWRKRVQNFGNARRFTFAFAVDIVRATITPQRRPLANMAPTATTGSKDAAAAETSSFTFDPFASARSFKYSGLVKAVYPLSPKPKIPPSIRRPNYAREGVRMWLLFWWQVRIPLLTVSLPLFLLRHADGYDLIAFLLLGLAIDAVKQFLESRNIKVNNKADQEGVRKAAIVRMGWSSLCGDLPERDKLTRVLCVCSRTTAGS